MAEWSITPTDATINSSGVASFPSNNTSVSKLYTVTYKDDSGCTGKTTYTVPACPPPTPPPTPDCNSYSFVNKSATQPSSGNEPVVVATSSKSKGQLTFSSAGSDNWISYVRVESDSSKYSYYCKASDNSSGSYRQGTAVFTSSDGCEFMATMSQDGRECYCSDIESGIVYENTFVPTTQTSNVLLFSADTQNCGSISAFCSSTSDNMFEEQSGNLVKVVAVESNRKYEVRANVLKMSTSGRRACDVNIYVYKSDGTLCKNITKSFYQDSTINCANLLNKYSGNFLQGKSCPGDATGLLKIAEGYYGESLMNNGVFIIEKPQGANYTWMDDPSNFSYKLVSDSFGHPKWEVYGYIRNPHRGIPDRDATYDQYGYIFDRPIEPDSGRTYTPAQLKSMSGTKCGMHEYKVHVIQEGCNCSHAWTGMTGNYLEYSAQTVTDDLSQYMTNCATATSHVRKEECNWVSGLSLIDSRYLTYTLTENGYTGRECPIEITITDRSGTTCTVNYRIYQYAKPLNCYDCNSIKQNIYDYSFYRIGADGSEASCINYNSKLTASSGCNGSISYSFSDDGVTNPIQGIRNNRKEDRVGSTYVYFTADANPDSTKRQKKVTVTYTSSSLVGTCEESFIIEQEAAGPAPGTCSSSSYDFDFRYLPSGKGANVNNPIVLKTGTTKTVIGTLANVIPSEYSQCAHISVTTSQNIALPEVGFEKNASGGYNIYVIPAQSALQADETAPVVVQWYYTNESGRDVYPSGDNSTIHVKVVNN